jgi:hypothetical protein
MNKVSVELVDTDQHLVFANIRKRLALSKQAVKKFKGEICNPRKLNDLEVRKK